jgi:hypothetical protein
MCCVNTALWYNNVNCEPQTKPNTSLIEHFGKECTLYNPDRHSTNKLGHGILGKINGCAEIGTPDKNDWIKTCDAQNQIYPQIVEVIELLRDMI